MNGTLGEEPCVWGRIAGKLINNHSFDSEKAEREKTYLSFTPCTYKKVLIFRKNSFGLIIRIELNGQTNENALRNL